MNIRNELAKYRISISDSQWSQRGSMHYLRVEKFVVEGTGWAIIKYAKAQKKKDVLGILELVQSGAIRILEASKTVISNCGLP